MVKRSRVEKTVLSEHIMNEYVNRECKGSIWKVAYLFGFDWNLFATIPEIERSWTDTDTYTSITLTHTHSIAIKTWI